MPKGKDVTNEILINDTNWQSFKAILFILV